MSRAQQHKMWSIFMHFDNFRILFSDVLNNPKEARLHVSKRLWQLWCRAYRFRAHQNKANQLNDLRQYKAIIIGVAPNSIAHTQLNGIYFQKIWSDCENVVFLNETQRYVSSDKVFEYIHFASKRQTITRDLYYAFAHDDIPRSV